MWSIGIITYILLVGYPPFNSRNMKVIYDKIRKGKPEYYQSEWDTLSKEALDFTNKCIQKDISKRLTPHKALKHAWIKNKSSFAGEVSPKVLRKLAHFRSPDKLKKEIFHFLASNMNTDTLTQMTNYFNTLDKDKKGQISIEDVLNKFEQLNLRSSRLGTLKDLHSKNKDLTINYSDFLTRVVDITKEIEHDDLLKAFQHFDSDNSGKITKEDLKNMMKRKGEDMTDDEIEKLIQQVDSSLSKEGKLNNPNRTEINFDTFKNYIYKLSPMSPSLRQEQFRTRDREENYSVDILEDNTSIENVENNYNMSASSSENSQAVIKQTGSFEFEVAFDDN